MSEQRIQAVWGLLFFFFFSMKTSTLFGEIEVNQELDQLFQSSAKAKKVKVETPKVMAVPEQEGDSVSSEEEEVEQETTVTSKVSGKKTRKQQKEELIEKNERTLFVGNVSTLVVEKEHTREFKKLFQEFGPLESIRFRSIAFAAHMPRKEAFLQKKFHEKRDTLNAYVVFQKKEDLEKALGLNGVVFMEKHLRVDRTETSQEKQRDTKKSVFVGNLSFDITDEALWTAFGDLDIEYVRVIRDRKTNVGKGFGYIQFKDKSAVPLALKLNGTSVGGRPVRVTKSSEKLADKGKEERKKVFEGTRAKRDSGGLKVKTKGSKVSKQAKPKTSKGKKKANK
jgi:nucleolar protein 12